jgi:hypothetical protein
MENMTHNFMTESFAGLTADSVHVQAMRVSEQADHSLCDLVNVPYVHKEAVAFADYGRDATGSCR